MIKTASIRNAALALVVVLAGIAGASSPLFTIDDGGIDYLDTSAETAYIGLAVADDGDLVLLLSHEPLEGGLPAVQLVVPDLGRVDFFGNDVGAELNDLAGLELVDYGLKYRSYSVVHESNSLVEVIAAYEDALAALGFVPDSVPAAGNVRVIRFVGDQGEVRAVFSATGHGVSVHLGGA